MDFRTWWANIDSETKIGFFLGLVLLLAALCVWWLGKDDVTTVEPAPMPTTGALVVLTALPTSTVTVVSTATVTPQIALRPSMTATVIPTETPMPTPTKVMVQRGDSGLGGEPT